MARVTTILGALMMMLMLGTSVTRAEQSCNVNINCAFLANRSDLLVMGTIVGNPSTSLVVTWSFPETSQVFTGTSTSCSPGDPNAVVLLDIVPFLGSPPGSLYFIKVPVGLVGGARRSTGQGSFNLTCYNIEKKGKGVK